MDCRRILEYHGTYEVKHQLTLEEHRRRRVIRTDRGQHLLVYPNVDVRRALDRLKQILAPKVDVAHRARRQPEFLTLGIVQCTWVKQGGGMSRVEPVRPAVFSDESAPNHHLNLFPRVLRGIVMLAEANRCGAAEFKLPVRSLRELFARLNREGSRTGHGRPPWSLGRTSPQRPEEPVPFGQTDLFRGRRGRREAAVCHLIVSVVVRLARGWQRPARQLRDQAEFPGPFVPGVRPDPVLAHLVAFGILRGCGNVVRVDERPQVGILFRPGRRVPYSALPR